MKELKFKMKDFRVGKVRVWFHTKRPFFLANLRFSGFSTG